MQAFTVYEDSISESRAQLQAITLIIGTLAGAKGFGIDNYDTLITKAALHGAKLLKKSHQATAVGLASHLWWQEAVPQAEGENGHSEPATEKPTTEKATEKPEDSESGIKSVRLVTYDVTKALSICSTPTRIVSAFWNAFKRHYVLPTLLSKRLLPSSCTAIPWIIISITSIMVHRR